MNSNWSYSPETKIWVVTSVTLTFDLWPWPFAWTLPWSNVITPENFMMIRWWEHSQKGVTDGQTDRRTDGQTDGQTDRRTENTIHRAAWSQLKIKQHNIEFCTFLWYTYLCTSRDTDSMWIAKWNLWHLLISPDPPSSPFWLCNKIRIIPIDMAPPNVITCDIIDECFITWPYRHSSYFHLTQWKTNMNYRKVCCHFIIDHIWGLCCHKQISQAVISNYILQFTVGCNYLSLPEIPASGNKVFIWHLCNEWCVSSWYIFKNFIMFHIFSTVCNFVSSIYLQ